MPILIPNFGLDNVRVMIFVDGENLAIRFGSFLQTNGLMPRHKVAYRPSVFAWSPDLSGYIMERGGMLRAHYYTAVQGDHDSVEEVSDALKKAGIEAPRVFKKARGARSKRVDITLATEMLLHATRKNYDIAVLVAGDEDYVPLVEAVQSEGRGVHVWFISDGISPKLVRAADNYLDLAPYLSKPLGSYEE